MHEDEPADAGVGRHCAAFGKADAQLAGIRKQTENVPLEGVVGAARIACGGLDDPGGRILRQLPFQPPVDPGGCGFRQRDPRGPLHQGVIVAFRGSACSMDADGEHACRGAEAVFHGRHEVAERPVLSVGLAQHGQAVAFADYFSAVAAAGVEPHAQHYPASSLPDHPVDGGHRIGVEFHGGFVLPLPDSETGVEQPPVEIGQNLPDVQFRHGHVVEELPAQEGSGREGGRGGGDALSAGMRFVVEPPEPFLLFVLQPLAFFAGGDQPAGQHCAGGCVGAVEYVAVKRGEPDRCVQGGGGCAPDYQGSVHASRRHLAAEGLHL